MFTNFALFTCIQIVWELDRIMGKSIAKEILETWSDFVPRIMEVSRQEVDNHYIQDILEDLPAELPEGQWYK